MKKQFIALLVIVITALAGCNSIGKTTVTAQTTHRIPSQSTASLDIRFATPTRHIFQTGIEQMLRQDLSRNLVSSRIFSVNGGVKLVQRAA
jgi:uridine kinase